MGKEQESLRDTFLIAGFAIIISNFATIIAKPAIINASPSLFLLRRERG